MIPRYPTLRSRLTATLAVLALAVASFASSTTQARASDDRAVKLLLGAAAVAIIASGVAQSRSQSQRHVTPRLHHKPQVQYHAPRHPQQHGRKYHRPHRQAHFLPGHCQTTYRLHGKHYRAYAANCLHRAGFRHLPSACVVRTTSGNLYASHCMRQHGFL